MRSRRLPGILLGCTLTLVIASAESSAQQKAAKANKAATSAAAKEETGSAVFYSDKLVGRPPSSLPSSKSLTLTREWRNC